MKRFTLSAKPTLAAIATILTVAVTLQSASAITINRNLITDGNGFPIASGTATGAPGTVAGTGTLTSVFNAAADWWENAIGDNHVYNVNYGWADVSGSTLGVATQFVIPQPGNGGDIRFDSTGTSWFMDSTPGDSAEWNTFTETSADLGGGTVNTGRVYSGATGAAAGNFDLMTVALHEIGHLLGVAGFGDFTDPLTITAPLPNAGTVIDTTGGHINVATSLMFPSIGSGQRRDASDIDILAVCEVSGFTQCELSSVENPTALPEPGGLALMGIGLFGLCVVRRRRQVATAS